MPIAGLGWSLLLAGGALALDAAAPPSAAHAVKSPDGVEIRYERAGSGEPTIVFVHGCDVGQSWSAEQKEAFLAPMRADFRKATDGFVRRAMFTPRAEPALIARIAEDMASAPPEVALSALRHLLDYDAAAALAAVKAPLRLLNADWWPTNLAAARKHKTDVELAVMPRVGHFLMAEDPAEFNRLLGRAVRELTTQ